MNKLVINTKTEGKTIHRNIYGHFSEHLGRCIYGGLYLDGTFNMPVVEALRAIKIPVLRWPGGCFADEYHWKDGIGPAAQRKKMINTHWGGVVEDNSFGTHEFMELCALLGCEPYINGNVGSGTVQEMSEWVEYVTFGGLSPMSDLRKQNGRAEPWALKYFAVGNENWGCGGNMRPEYYADEYRRYQTYVRSYGQNKIYKIACGADSANYQWTEVLMERAARYMDGLSLHYYTVPTGNWGTRGSATGFDASGYYDTIYRALKMEELVSNHARIMDKYDPEKRIGMIVDEWGTWYDAETGTNPGFLYQQNTMRDAMVAAVTLNIFNRHCDRVTMANLAQTVNVLQAVLLTEGSRVVKTPTYHVFDLYKAHHDAALLDSYIETAFVGQEKIPQLDVSASRNEDVITVTLANISATESCRISCDIDARVKNARILTGGIQAHNTMEEPDAVRITDFADIKDNTGGFELTIPACAILEITLQ